MVKTTTAHFNDYKIYFFIKTDVFEYEFSLVHIFLRKTNTEQLKITI